MRTRQEGAAPRGVSEPVGRASTVQRGRDIVRRSGSRRARAGVVTVGPLAAKRLLAAQGLAPVGPATVGWLAAQRLAGWPRCSWVVANQVDGWPRSGWPWWPRLGGQLTAEPLGRVGGGAVVRLGGWPLAAAREGRLAVALAGLVT